MTAQIDPFASVRVKSKTQQPSSRNSTQQNEEDPFAQVRVNKAEGMPFYETGRHATRIGSRIAETIGGIPGDVSSLIQSGVFYGAEKLFGKKIPKEIREEASKNRLPTSQELKQLSEKSTGGFTSAQSEIEKSGDELVETLASLLGPMKFRKALGVAVGSQAAKEGLKISGFGEGTQEAGKLGTMFLLSVYNPGGALKFSESQYQKANQLSRGAKINAVPFEGHLVNLVNDLKKGVTTSEKTSVIKPAKELIGKVKRGKILVQDLTAAKRDINKIMGEPETLKGAKKLLRHPGREVDKAIKPYELINPAFSKVYRPANEIHGAVMQGHKASNFIKKILGTKSVLAATLAEAAFGHPELIVPTAGAAAATFGAAKGIDFFTRLAKSPELQKYYGKAAVAAAAEDAPSLRLYADKIEKELENPQLSSRSMK